MRPFIIGSQNHDCPFPQNHSQCHVRSVNGVKLTLDYNAGQICTLIIMGTFMPFPFFLSVGINSFLNIDDCYCGKGECRRILSGGKSGKGTSINHSDHHE